MTKTAGDAIAQFLEEVQHLDELHPECDEELLFHRRYRIAHYRSPKGKLPSPSCQEANPKSPPIYISKEKMQSHYKLQHPKAKIKCEQTDCTVLFLSHADKEDHISYCHTKSYGWWIR